MTHRDPHYQLQHNIVNNIWYVNPYDQDQIRFRDHDIKYVDRAIVLCGLELEFPPNCREAILENLYFLRSQSCYLFPLMLKS